MISQLGFGISYMSLVAISKKPLAEHDCVNDLDKDTDGEQKHEEDLRSSALRTPPTLSSCQALLLYAAASDRNMISTSRLIIIPSILV